MTASSDPVRQASFYVQEEEHVTEFIREAYVGNLVTFDSAVERRIGFGAHVGEVADVACSRVRSGIDYRVSTEPFDSYVFFAVRRGRIGVRSGTEEIGFHAGNVGLYPLGSGVGAHAQDQEADLLRLRPSRLDRVATEMSGLAPGELQFHAMTPVSAAMGAYWRSVMTLVNGAVLAAESPMNSPLLAEEMIRTAAVGALHVFPNTTMTRQHVAGPGRVEPAALRRAVAYIEANAARAVTLSEIAEAAGTGPRALQYAFRRQHDLTPLGYARRLRLEHAHRDLQAGDPARGDTVAAIAARWGFTKPDRFAALYRDRFGKLPSHTLRR